MVTLDIMRSFTRNPIVNECGKYNVYNHSWLIPIRRHTIYRLLTVWNRHHRISYNKTLSLVFGHGKIQFDVFERSQAIRTKKKQRD
jgi:hypothetical protein